MRRLSAALLAFPLILSGCFFGPNQGEFSGEEIFTIRANQDNTVFTFNVSIDQASYDKLSAQGVSFDEIFLWIRLDAGWGYFEYNPLDRKTASLESLLDPDGAGPTPGGVDVVFDFAEAARRWDIWWISDDMVNGDGMQDIQDMKVIAATSYLQGWIEMDLDGEYVSFSSSYPAGDYISNVFHGTMDQNDADGDGFGPIVSTTAGAGLYVSDGFVEDDGTFFVRLQTEADTSINSDPSGTAFKVPDPVVYFNGAGSPLTLNFGSISGLSNPSLGRYVWEINVDTAGGAPVGSEIVIQPNDNEQWIQVQGSPSQWGSDTKDVQFAGTFANAAYLFAETDFDGTFTNMDPINLSSVYTEQLTYPYSMTPAQTGHNWVHGDPARDNPQATNGMALGTGEGGDIDASYGTMRNDLFDLPVTATTYAGGRVWIVFDAYVDFSDAWEDRFSIEVNGSPYFDASEPIEWSWVGDRDPNIQNGWKTLGVDLGNLSNGTSIRFRFRSDNIYDGRTGILIDNLKIYRK